MTHQHTHHFVKVGGQMVNLNDVVRVDLPVEGDPKKPLTVHCAHGGNLSLSGDDAADLLAVLDGCCEHPPARKKDDDKDDKAKAAADAKAAAAEDKADAKAADAKAAADKADTKAADAKAHHSPHPAPHPAPHGKK